MAWYCCSVGLAMIVAGAVFLASPVLQRIGWMDGPQLTASEQRVFAMVGITGMPAAAELWR